MKRLSRKKSAKKTVVKKKVNFIPPGYHTVTPYLACRGAAAAIEFYVKAFGARELMRMPAQGGKIGHAEVRIGDSRVMLADEYPDMDFLGPEARGGSAVHLNVYVRDVDRVIEGAVAAGARLVREVQDQFYGDRSGAVADPFGHIWHVATHKEDLSKAQLRKRSEQAMKAAGG
jgi:PhnB protein